MVTLKFEEEEEELSNSSTMNNNNNTEDKKTSLVSFPAEITDEILSRLPVKSLLQSKSVSKPWLCRISHPSFTKLHFTRSIASKRVALFMSAYDVNTHKRYFFSGPHDGGPLTHLKTLDGLASLNDCLQTIHSNGLVFLICINRSSNRFQYVINPSTRNIFKLPDCSSENNIPICYSFGFDKSSDEHKVLNISKPIHGQATTTTLDIMIFSFSTYSWRKISVELPVGFTCDSVYYDLKGGVCIDSVVHMMAHGPCILAFDLRTESFSVITTPPILSEYAALNKPYIINVNGFLGLVCREWVFERNRLDIWILQDYETRVWVRETIKFPSRWLDLGCPLPFDSRKMDEIIFTLVKVCKDQMLSVPVYNKKTRCLKYLEFTLGHEFQCLEDVRIELARCYVESIQPI